MTLFTMTFMTLFLLDKASLIFFSKAWWTGSAHARVARVKLTHPSVHSYHHSAPVGDSPFSIALLRLAS